MKLPGQPLGNPVELAHHLLPTRDFLLAEILDRSEVLRVSRSDLGGALFTQRRHQPGQFVKLRGQGLFVAGIPRQVLLLGLVKVFHQPVGGGEESDRHLVELAAQLGTQPPYPLLVVGLELCVFLVDQVTGLRNRLGKQVGVPIRVRQPMKPFIDRLGQFFHGELHR